MQKNKMLKKFSFIAKTKFITIYITSLVILSSIFLGILFTQWIPSLLNIPYIAFMPLFFSSLLGLYLNSIKDNINILTPEDKEWKIAELYGQGSSFQKIQKKLELSSLSEVRRLLAKFCLYYTKNSQ